MLKKLFITAAAAAVVSVPLAGMAWAEPSSDPGTNDKGSSGENKLGKGGVPKHLGEVLHEINSDTYPSDPISPGSIASDVAGMPGSVPDAFGNFVNGFWGLVGVETDYGPTAPGLAVKQFTPGCTHGRQATEVDGTITAGTGPCH